MIQNFVIEVVTDSILEISVGNTIEVDKLDFSIAEECDDIPKKNFMITSIDYIHFNGNTVISGTCEVLENGS